MILDTMTKKEQKATEAEEAKQNIEDVSFDDAAPEKKEEASKSKKKRTKKSKKSAADEKIEALELKYAETNDKYLRLYSEFDNYRKRTLKEKLELTKTASEDIIVDLLPILDDFDRALQAMAEAKANDEAIKGTELIYNKLFKILEQRGLEPMNSMEKEFDTDYHEAITNIKAPKKNLVGKVVDVIQRGYLLHGKIIRFAKVVVGN